MRKNPLLIELFCLVLAGLAAYASTILHNPLLLSSAFVCFSLFLFIAAGDALVSKKIGFFPKNPNFGPTETYQGIAAQLLGGIFTLLVDHGCSKSDVEGWAG
jgi:hypothetical protein